MGKTAAERRMGELGALRKWTEGDAREALSVLGSRVRRERQRCSGRRLGNRARQRLLWWRSR